MPRQMRSVALAAVREGNQLKYFYDRQLAEKVLIPSSVSATVDDAIFRVAKHILSSMEVANSHTSSGIGQALGDLKKRISTEDRGWIRRLRDVHASYSLTRHLTEIGEAEFLREFDAFMLRLAPAGQGSSDNFGAVSSMGIGVDTSAAAAPPAIVKTMGTNATPILSKRALKRARQRARRRAIEELGSDVDDR